MTSGRIRSTRRLCSWMVEQVSSGKYPGLIWDDESKTMFRIPWKHAGKQDFRRDEDAAIFKAWAEFKGKLSDEGREDPASWKTRLRCALNKSPEFEEVAERSQLDISEPYKVYRLVPINEQGVVVLERKCTGKTQRRQKRKISDSGDENDFQPKPMKEEVVTSQLRVEDIIMGSEVTLQEEQTQQIVHLQGEGAVNEIQLSVRIETISPPGVQDSFHVVVKYSGVEVLQREVLGNDVRITYLPPSPVPPTPASLMGFPRISLPEPPTLASSPEVKLQLQALSTLLPYMEKGVVLTSSASGVYASRFCRGRVFWIGPHTTTPGLHKMERNAKPELLFSQEAFKQQLDHFRVNGGEPPRCDITLCFGEELSDAEDPSSKLIIVQITLPWAQQQVQNAQQHVQNAQWQVQNTQQQLQDAQAIMESINILQTLASQSPLGEITLNLVPVPLSVEVQAS